jgi:U3 small nucleolar RNA-associated protein 7
LPDAKAPKALRKIRDKKLRSKLSDIHISQKRATQHAKDVNEFLYGPAVGEEAGLIETEDALERTARVTQKEIRQSVTVDAARKSFTLDLSGGKSHAGRGPYRCSYTRNGRHLLLGGRKGHLAAMDWQTGKLLCEINVNETVRDVTWLHSNAFFAAAQKKHTYIYDGQGVEIHRLKQHTEVHRMEFLPYHFLLATIGQAGYLRYQDTSTGNIVAEHRTGLGSCMTMAQNPLTAVINLGHSEGTVTMWTPNLSSPALKMLAHRGPVSGISVAANGGGREMATSGMDGSVKVWDTRMLGRGAVREWVSRRPASDIQYSQRGLLGIAWGSHVSVYDTQRKMGNAPPGPYLTNGFPKGEPISINFCPFEDVLGVAHASGFESLLIPGSGEPRFDSSEADPFESRTSRREREVRSLLDKIKPDTITLDPDMLGQLNVETDEGYVPDTNPASLPSSADGRFFRRLTRIERLRLQGKADEGDQAAIAEVRQRSKQETNEDEDETESQGDSDDESGGAKGSVPLRDWNEPTYIGKGKDKSKHRMRGRNGAQKRVAVKRFKAVDNVNVAAKRAQLAAGQRQDSMQSNIAGNAGMNDQPSTDALGYFSRRSNKRKKT